MSYEFHQINDPAEIDDGRELEPIEEVEDRPVAWPSPLLRKTKLDCTFDELETP